MDQETPFNDARSTGSLPIDPLTSSIPSSRSVTLTPATQVPHQPTQLQSLLMSRLTRLVRMEAEWRHRVSDQDWRIKMLHKTIYSTYCDCVAEGIATAASEIVRRGRGDILS